MYQHTLISGFLGIYQFVLKLFLLVSTLSWEWGDWVQGEQKVAESNQQFGSEEVKVNGGQVVKCKDKFIDLVHVKSSQSCQVELDAMVTDNSVLF